MKNFALKTLVVGMMSTVAVVASADQVVINPGLQYLKNDGERNVSDHSAPTIGIEYLTDKQWSVGLTLAKSNQDAEQGSTGPDFHSIPGVTQNPDLFTYHVDGNYYFAKAGDKLAPYATVGLGDSKWNYGPMDHVETQVTAGAGVKYEVLPHLSVNALLVGVYGLDENTVDKGAVVGLSYAVDVSRPRVAPAPVAAPVVVKPAAPAPAPVKTTVETIKLKVQFPTDSSVVNKAYFSEIQKVADFMKKYPDTSVVIEGHTDSTGKAEHNKTLSSNRANAVREILVKNFGIDAARTSAVGYGAEKPVADNKTSSGKQENRRVMAVMQKEVIVK